MSRNKIGEGKIAEKLTDRLDEFFSEYTFSTDNCFRIYSTVKWDLARWGAYGYKMMNGKRWSLYVYSWDTMTDIVKCNKIHIIEKDHAASMVEISV